jgi:DNA-binding transcriptional LysR family regulator
MDIPAHVSTDQLEVLVGVVDHGGFTAAARAQGRTQGAVSYHVARLEEQLEVELFDRSAHRPTLTEAGAAVVRHAREVLRGLDALKSTARALQNGIEGQLVLAVDILFPPVEVAALMTAFEARFPGVELLLRAGVWDEPLDELRAGHADLAIAPAPLVERDLSARVCSTVDFVPVVAADHPLASAPSPVSAEELNRHRRLVLMTGSPLPADATVRERVWRLTDNAMRRGLILEGVGWSRMPRFQVAEDLRAGRLVELEVKDWLGVTSIDLALMYEERRGLGPAGRWVVDFLTAESS